MPVKKKKSQKVRATKSFEQMLSQAQLNALKPYIAEQVQENIARLIPMLTKLLAEPLSQVQNRLLGVEEVLEVDKGALANALATIEDSALGLILSPDPAKAGDAIRLEILTEGGESDKILIQRLLHKNEQGQVQTMFEGLEKAIVGMMVEEIKSVDDGENMITFKVVKISTKEDANA